MTKRHFIALADAIREHNRCAQPVNGKREVFTASQLATLRQFCASQNFAFDRERWTRYIAGECGPNGGTIKPAPKPRRMTPQRKLARRLQGL